MKNKDVYVGLIDSGCRFDTYEKISFKLVNENVVVSKPNKKLLDHGDEIGQIISSCKNVKIYDVQIFENKLNISALLLYKALEYLFEKKVDVISLSLGILTNYKEIEEICNKFTKKGVIIVSSFPRSGQNFVYPASYKNVISVTSDGNCEGFEVSNLHKNLELFGCNPFSNKKNVAGSSVAVAKFTKVLCEYLAKGYTKNEALAYIKQQG